MDGIDERAGPGVAWRGLVGVEGDVVGALMNDYVTGGDAWSLIVPGKSLEFGVWFENPQAFALENAGDGLVEGWVAVGDVINECVSVQGLKGGHVVVVEFDFGVVRGKTLEAGGWYWEDIAERLRFLVKSIAGDDVRVVGHLLDEELSDAVAQAFQEVIFNDVLGELAGLARGDGSVRRWRVHSRFVRGCRRLAAGGRRAECRSS